MDWRVVVVVSLLVLGGCGFLPADGGDGQDETVTPAPVPTVTVTPTPEQRSLPPGVRRTGVVDVQALVAAHRKAITNQSYVWRARRGTTTEVNGSLQNSSVPTVTWISARVESERVYSLRTDRERLTLSSGPTLVADYREYADGEYRHVGYDVPWAVDYEVRSRMVVAARHNDNIGRAMTTAIVRYLSVENAIVSLTSVDGRRHYAVVARSEAPSGYVTGEGNVTEYTARAVISPDGFVRSLNVTFLVADERRRQQFYYSFTYDDVDETTVERPQWVLRATNQTNDSRPSSRATSHSRSRTRSRQVPSRTFTRDGGTTLKRWTRGHTPVRFPRRYYGTPANGDRGRSRTVASRRET